MLCSVVRIFIHSLQNFGKRTSERSERMSFSEVLQRRGGGGGGGRGESEMITKRLKCDEFSLKISYCS